MPHRTEGSKNDTTWPDDVEPHVSPGLAPVNAYILLVQSPEGFIKITPAGAKQLLPAPKLLAPVDHGS